MNIAAEFRNLPARTDHTQSLQSLSLLHLRNFLRREWRIITFFTVASIALGAIYVTTAQRKFTARTNMFIDTRGITETQSERPSEPRNIDDSTVESEIETTKSERVGKAVVDKLHLTQDPEFASGREGIVTHVARLLHLERPPADASADDELTRRALDTLAANLRVTRVGRSYVEEIAYTSPDPDKAARIANAVAEAYIEYRLQAKYEATRRASDWLDQRIAALRKQTTSAYKAVQDYKAENSIIIGPDGKLASDIELDQLGVSLAKARAATSEAQARMDRIQRVLQERPKKENFTIPDPVVTDALNSPVITKLRQKFLEDQNKESDWAARYGTQHEAVKNLRSEMAALRGSIWDEISRIAESYKSELQIAKDQEQAIEKRMIEVFQKSGATRQAQVRLQELQTGASTYRGIYEAFLARFTQSVQQQSFPTTEARVVTDASPPKKPSSPKIALALAFAAVCGLGLGAISAIAREQFMQSRIYTREQLEKLLGIACLAALPALSQLRARLGTRHSSAFHQISKAPPFSALAESLRHIKVAIDLQPGRPKIIGLTSALPGEGKTTLALAFAAFLAKNGARTLLVDADLRNPSMSAALGYIREPGLSRMAIDNLELDKLVIPDRQFRFDVLPSPSTMRASNSSDILSSSRIAAELQRARSRYDYIICDLPPVLPIVDVKAVANLFEAFVMIVEWGASTDEILNATRSSPILSERLLGVVLNKTDEQWMQRLEGYSDKRYSYYRRH